MQRKAKKKYTEIKASELLALTKTALTEEKAMIIDRRQSGTFHQINVNKLKFMTTGKPGFTEPKKEDVAPDTLIKVPVDATKSSDYIRAANKAGITLFRTFNPDAAGNESIKRLVPVNAGSVI